MQTLSILYLLCAFLCSVSIGYFQYFYKVKSKKSIHILLCALKTLSLFLLLALFISPKIKTTTFQTIKPILSILVDNSKSISYFKEEKNLQDFSSKLNNNARLSDKFEIQNYVFSADLKSSDSIDFLGSATNIYNAVSVVNKLNTEKKAPILLLTDGNQTIGNAYQFMKSEQKVYPIIFGDTSKHTDIKITQINVNKYSYLNNKFPVEVLLNYDGTGSVKKTFSIYSVGKKIFSKRIQFSKKERSRIIRLDLAALKVGVNYFTAEIEKIKNEKNIKNNTKIFSVEVIDEQARVLLLADVLHPDIGALKKAIESNPQRAVTISRVTEFKDNFSEFQLVILYQPNNVFEDVFSKIRKAQCNLLIVTGTNTNWALLNKQQFGFTKNFLQETETYGARHHTSFSVFLQKDIGFSGFPPLKDAFGGLDFYKQHEDLVLQEIRGVETTQPLISFFEEEKQKIAVIFGEGIWRWRAESFLSSNTFQDFDQFIGNALQYLTTNKNSARLEVNSEHVYASNTIVNIAAFFTDTNYKFDDSVSLEITLTNNETKKETKLPFSLRNNSYQIAIENLSPGVYNFKVGVVDQSHEKYGSFKITKYQIEAQFTHADVFKLEQLALNTGGAPFYKDEITRLIQELLADKTYYSEQKAIVKEQSLLEWKWLLLIIISLSTVEWILRKYSGKI